MAQQAKSVQTNALDQLAHALFIEPSDLQAGLHVTEQEFLSWQATGEAPTMAARQQLETLTALRDGLSELFAKPEGVQEWMRIGMRDLKWRTPQQAIRDGQPDKALAAYLRLAHGIFV